MNKIVLMATSLLVLGANSVLACSCIQGTPETYLENANTVFSGRVIDVIDTNGQKPNSNEFMNSEKRVTFEVAQVWKGKNKRRLVITTSESSASCGYNFQKGEKYLVYAHTSERSRQLNTGLCSGTKPLEQAQADLRVLGQGKKSADR